MRFLRLPLFLLVCFLAACQPEVSNNNVPNGNCGPATCNGCCNALGACIQSPNQSNCGSAGAQCEVCDQRETCNAGVCVCNGCLAGDDCVAGDSNDACGGVGANCERCTVGTECFDFECQTPPDCGPSNCASGCCNGDTCVENAGENDTTCGTGGVECQNCSANNADCNAGKCEARCADTCDGCCDGETCIPRDNTGNSQCGLAGAACTNCLNAQSECSNGECVPTSCSGSCGGCCDGNGNTDCITNTSSSQCGVSGQNGEACIACPGGAACTNGVCDIDPNSLWKITIESGKVAPLKPNGNSWDAFGGQPDPKIRLTVGEGTADEQSEQSNKVTNTTVPDFQNEVVLENIPARLLLGNATDALLKIEWRDDDLIGNNDMMEISVGHSEFFFRTGSRVHVCTTSGQLEFCDPTLENQYQLFYFISPM